LAPTRLATVHPTLGTANLVLARTSDLEGWLRTAATCSGIRATIADTELVRIDTATGAESLIGSTGMTALTALTMDNGTCYG